MRSLSPTKTKAVCIKGAFLAALAAASLVICTDVRAREEPAHPAEIDDAIIAAAKRHGVPEHLVRRVIMRESKYNPRARNRRYWGLMQISYPTARSMGFKGTPQELLNPVVNLRYAVPYLANAFICAGKRDDAAVRLYAAGYYFTARTRGLLSALRTAESTPLNGIADEPSAQPTLAANAVAQQPESVGVFGALFSPGQQPAPQPQVAAYSADASATAQQQQPRPAVTETAVAPAGTFKGKAVAMEVGKSGEAAPPKKWTRDGGTSVIARGEQPITRVAANDRGDDNNASGRKSRRHARKITLVATLDEQPATAQAYAAAPGQDPRFAAAPSQAAISQATSAPPPAAPQQVDAFGQPAATPQVDAFGRPIPPLQPAAQSAAAAPAAGTSVQAKADDDEKPAKRKRSRHAKKHKSKDETQVAERKDPPAATPELRQTQTQ